MSRVPITKDGEISIKEKLSNLKFVERPQISQAIAEARAHGDLKENAEYHAAKELQGLVEAKISEMESTLANAQVIDVKEIPETGRVIFGSTIKVYDIEHNNEVVYKMLATLSLILKKDTYQLIPQLQKDWLVSLLMTKLRLILLQVTSTTKS